MNRHQGKMRSPATAIAVVALFFSLAGTGIAASHYFITSVAQIKPSVVAQLRGSRGPVGATGPQGPVGATGATGETGATGAQGAAGPTGATGAVGPQGPSGFGGLEYIGGTGVVLRSKGATATVTVTCPEGTHVVGGWLEVEQQLGGTLVNPDVSPTEISERGFYVPGGPRSSVGFERSWGFLVTDLSTGVYTVTPNAQCAEF